MFYKLIVNAIEIYSSKHDNSPKFYSKNDLVNLIVSNIHGIARVTLTFSTLDREYTYTFEDVSLQEIDHLKDFFGI
jgi:hypothetical protein